MAVKYLIDRTELPYDAFVADPSWLIPVDDDEEGGDTHGDKGKEADAHGDQGTGGQSGKAETERE